MNDIVHVRNLDTGQVGKISRHLFEHPYFNPGILVEVEKDAKPYAAELYRSKITPAEVHAAATDDPDEKVTIDE